MVSRDDTAAMHRLIARWLRGEVERLARVAADSNMLLVERGRVVRALLHSLGVLAVFFRCVCVHIHHEKTHACLLGLACVLGCTRERGVEI